MQMLRFLDPSASSFIIKDNRIGDRVSPCLTPNDISIHSVQQLFFIFNFTVRYLLHKIWHIYIWQNGLRVRHA